MEAAQPSLLSSWILKSQAMSDLKRHEDTVMLTSSEITNLGRTRIPSHWLPGGLSCLHRVPLLAASLYSHLTDGTQFKDQININLKRVVIRSTLEFRSEGGGRRLIA